MFDTYADRIVLTGCADEEFLTRLAGHLANPQGPVHVTSAPGNAKTYFTVQAARTAGFAPVEVNTANTDAFNVQFLDMRITKTDRPVVLIIEENAVSSPSTYVSRKHLKALRPALRELAAHPNVHATVVLHTT